MTTGIVVTSAEMFEVIPKTRWSERHLCQSRAWLKREARHVVPSGARDVERRIGPDGFITNEPLLGSCPGKQLLVDASSVRSRFCVFREFKLGSIESARGARVHPSRENDPSWVVIAGVVGHTTKSILVSHASPLGMRQIAGRLSRFAFVRLHVMVVFVDGLRSNLRLQT